jgi:hypothetical protein
LREAHQILDNIISDTKSSDLRARASGAKWFERHRLHFLLESVVRAKKSTRKDEMFNPWYIIELKSTVDLIKKWKIDEIWQDIEPSLKDKDSYMHTVGKLFLIEMFRDRGDNIELVPKSKGASPDLKIQAVGGAEEWVYIECYQPNIFSGELSDISDRRIKKAVNRAMDKAKRQFSRLNPGIIAIIGYNQPSDNWERLQKYCTIRLDNTDRPYLGGFYLVDLGVLRTLTDEGSSFRMKISLVFITNPSYFGRIDIIDPILETKPIVIENRGTKKSSEILDMTLSEIKKDPQKNSRKKRNEIKRKTHTIKLIPYKHANSEKDTIFTIKIENEPLFRGQSNINYACSECGRILAEKIWRFSFINVIFRCPDCQTDGKIPAQELPLHPIKGTIGMQVGLHVFGRVANITQGVSLIGGIPTRAILNLTQTN